MSNKLMESYQAYQGFLRIAKVRESDGEIVEIVNVKNVITYTATNLMARSIAGDVTYKVSTFRVGGKTGAASVPAGTATRDDTELDILVAYPGDDPEIVEFPAISPSYTGEASPGNGAPELQNNNIVTFTGIMPSQGSFDGKHFHEAGLFASVGGGLTMFSHQFHTPIEKQNGFNLVYTWSIKYL